MIMTLMMMAPGNDDNDCDVVIRNYDCDDDDDS